MRNLFAILVIGMFSGCHFSDKSQAPTPSTKGSILATKRFQEEEQNALSRAGTLYLRAVQEMKKKRQPLPPPFISAYQPYVSCLGGYFDRKLSEGVYTISFVASMQTPVELADAWTYLRAIEVCQQDHYRLASLFNNERIRDTIPSQISSPDISR